MNTPHAIPPAAVRSTRFNTKNQRPFPPQGPPPNEPLPPTPTSEVRHHSSKETVYQPPQAFSSPSFGHVELHKKEVQTSQSSAKLQGVQVEIPLALPFEQGKAPGSFSTARPVSFSRGSGSTPQGASFSVALPYDEENSEVERVTQNSTDVHLNQGQMQTLAGKNSSLVVMVRHLVQSALKPFRSATDELKDSGQAKIPQPGENIESFFASSANENSSALYCTVEDEYKDVPANKPKQRQRSHSFDILRHHVPTSIATAISANAESPDDGKPTSSWLESSPIFHRRNKSQGHLGYFKNDDGNDRVKNIFSATKPRIFVPEMSERPLTPSTLKNEKRRYFGKFSSSVRLHSSQDGPSLQRAQPLAQKDGSVPAKKNHHATTVPNQIKKRVSRSNHHRRTNDVPVVVSPRISSLTGGQDRYPSISGILSSDNFTPEKDSNFLLAHVKPPFAQVEQTNSKIEHVNSQRLMYAHTENLNLPLESYSTETDSSFLALSRDRSVKGELINEESDHVAGMPPTQHLRKNSAAHLRYLAEGPSKIAHVATSSNEPHDSLGKFGAKTSFQFSSFADEKKYENTAIYASGDKKIIRSSRDLNRLLPMLPLATRKVADPDVGSRCYVDLRSTDLDWFIELSRYGKPGLYDVNEADSEWKKSMTKVAQLKRLRTIAQENIIPSSSLFLENALKVISKETFLEYEGVYARELTRTTRHEGAQNIGQALRGKIFDALIAFCETSGRDPMLQVTCGYLERFDSLGGSLGLLFPLGETHQLPGYPHITFRAWLEAAKVAKGAVQRWLEVADFSLENIFVQTVPPDHDTVELVVRINTPIYDALEEAKVLAWGRGSLNF